MSESRISRKEETSEGVDGFWDAQGVAPLGLSVCGERDFYKHAAPLGLRHFYRARFRENKRAKEPRTDEEVLMGTTHVRYNGKLFICVIRVIRVIRDSDKHNKQTNLIGEHEERAINRPTTNRRTF